MVPEFQHLFLIRCVTGISSSCPTVTLHLYYELIKLRKVFDPQPFLDYFVMLDAVILLLILTVNFPRASFLLWSPGSIVKEEFINNIG